MSWASTISIIWQQDKHYQTSYWTKDGTKMALRWRQEDPIHRQCAQGLSTLHMTNVHRHCNIMQTCRHVWNIGAAISSAYPSWTYSIFAWSIHREHGTIVMSFYYSNNIATGQAFTNILDNRWNQDGPEMAPRWPHSPPVCPGTFNFAHDKRTSSL